MTDKLVLAIDGSNWVHRAFHVPGTGRHKGATVFCQMLQKADRTFGPSHLVVAFDHSAPTWRHAILPSYKGERDPKPAELVEDLELARQAAIAYGCQTFQVPGYEADDILATVAARATAAGVRCMVASSDKDLLQLVGPTVRVLDANYNVLTPLDVESKWRVGPDKLRDVLALMGDSTDSVPGVDGIGPAIAAQLVGEYGSAMDAVAHATDVGGKRGAALVTSTLLVQTALRVVALKCDVDLGCKLKATVRTPDVYAAFVKKLTEPPPVSRSVPCYGVCGGDPNWRDEHGHGCTLCGSSGKVTTYNERELQARDWDSVCHKERVT